MQIIMFPDRMGQSRYTVHHEDNPQHHILGCFDVRQTEASIKRLPSGPSPPGMRWKNPEGKVFPQQPNVRYTYRLPVPALIDSHNSKKSSTPKRRLGTPSGSADMGDRNLKNSILSAACVEAQWIRHIDPFVSVRLRTDVSREPSFFFFPDVGGLVKGYKALLGFRVARYLGYSAGKGGVVYY